MNYLNIRISELRSEAFLHASNSQKGQWLELCAYCCTQHNSGRIHNCKNWAPMQWVRITGTETPETPCPLWHWNRDDLVIEFYPVQQELEYLNKAGSAREANRIRWAKKHGFTHETEM